MKKYLSYAALGTAFAGCVSYFLFTQHPSSTSRHVSSETNMTPAIALLNEVSLAFDEKSTWKELCNTDLKKESETFLSLPLEENIHTIPTNEISGHIEKSFRTRLALKEKLRTFNMDAESSKACWEKFRAINRSLRYFEDYLIEMQTPSTASIADYTTLEGEGSFYLKNPNFQISDANSLQSGDVILSRGNAFVSALIAQITDIPNQFSHISFVYKDDNGKLWTIESHIEIGAVVAPIEKHVEEKNARTVVYRYKDQQLAHKAAEYIFNMVKAKQDTGKNVQYDFGMGLDNPKRLFCSEVAYQGFWLTAKISVPKYKNKFPPKLYNFLNQLGIKVNEKTILNYETFAPGDIEYDPDFSLVAEWRNPVKMKLSQIRDALMKKEIEWITEKNYEFDPSFKTNLKSYAGWLARRTPGVKKKLEDKFPLNMTPTQLKVNITIEDVSAIIEKRFWEIMEKSDHRLTYSEILLTLEKIREEDFQLYEKGEKSLFHKLFHPKKIYPKTPENYEAY